MRIPGPNDLAELRGKTRTFYAIWLVEGLTGYLFRKEGRSAFAGAEYFIENDRDSSIGSDFEVIVGALDANDALEFRAACVLAVKATIRQAQLPDEVAAEILRICAFIKVPEIVIVLQEAIASGAIPSGSKLGYLAREVIRDLSD